MKIALNEMAWPSVRDSEEEAEEQRYMAHLDGACFYMDRCEFCEDETRRNTYALMRSFDWAFRRIVGE
jgi:hypothetical protein